MAGLLFQNVGCAHLVAQISLLRRFAAAEVEGDYAQFEMFAELPSSFSFHDISDDHWIYRLFKIVAERVLREEYIIRLPIFEFDEVLIPNTRFSGIFLPQMETFKVNGHELGVRRVYPLYKSEIEFRAKHGNAHFLNFMEENGVPMHLEIGRKPFA